MDNRNWTTQQEMDIYSIFPPREDCLDGLARRWYHKRRIDYQNTSSKTFRVWRLFDVLWTLVAYYLPPTGRNRSRVSTTLDPENCSALRAAVHLDDWRLMTALSASTSITLIRSQLKKEKDKSTNRWRTTDGDNLVSCSSESKILSKKQMTMRSLLQQWARGVGIRYVDRKSHFLVCHHKVLSTST